MAELATIARPYAEALFRVAKAADLNNWSALVSEMAQVAANPDLRELAHNPKVSDADIAAVFTAALKSPVGNEAKNFIAMLVENDRLTLLPEIAEQFFELKNAEQGSADAQIVSAFELSSAQVAELVATLEKKFGRKLNPIVTVDSALIGGVRVVVGDEVLDTSVRAKLQQMQIALTA
ncbi:ATP synthase subunit delta [Oxalicibacterium flavum]|uniref:ATP synthase subunit delta n=1 Tax=Oxalicibacterium flavum TaxID=179467 RepID=A0A8J2XYB0_9BURK|nr:F0F1 ATP synthase subunit delta [Oxalicibacterium flavum]GGC11186.1 ATP synthase subunit delta [Oxalicibacterium flavum]